MAEQTTTLEQAAAGQDAGLDAAIAQMETTLFPSDAPAAPAEQTPSTPESGQQAPTEQPADTTAQEPDGQDDESEDQASVEPGQRPASRMGRLRAQLTQAEQKAREAETRLQQRQAFEQETLRRFVDLVLPDHELESLRVRAENGDWEAKQRVDLARQWRQMVTPIADMAHQAVAQQFNQALADLRTLDGMDGDAHQRLVQAATPGDKLKLMWQFGKKLSDDAHKERIAELEQEVQALRTNKTASGSQPASGGSPKNGTPVGLAGLVGRDGQLTDDGMNLTPAQIRERFGRVA